MSDNLLSPVDDWIFKLLFGDERNKSILIDLLKAFVRLPDEDFDITFLDTHLKREAKDDKLGILDVKLKTKSGKIIDIEIQVNPFRQIGKRVSFYKSRLITEQVSDGEDYSVIEKVICVLFVAYKLFPRRDDYINRFVFCDLETGLVFEEIPEEIYTIELPKLPSVNDGTHAYQWTKFLQSKTKEEFDMLAQTNPQIKKAADQLYKLSSSADVRAEYERRRKAQMDWDSRIKDGYLDGLEEGEAKGILKGKQQGLAEGMEKIAKELKADGMPLEKIAKMTGLSLDAIKKLF